MTSLLHRPVVRWLAPATAAVVFIGGGSLISALTNAAQADLAPRSAARLLVDIQQAKVAGLSGTIVQNADLGIPALPANLPGTGSDLTSLVSGSHTLRVWYAGPEHTRVSLLGQFGESDVIRNGSDLWSWSSSGRSAQHWVLPAHARESSTTLQQPVTPQQAADKALAAISPTTLVTTDGTTTVAGRSAYLLTLEPKSTDTLVRSVQVAIDGSTHVPTRVQVFAKGMTSPVLSVGFTSFDPSTPSMSVFGFNPPPGTKVTQHSRDQLGNDSPSGKPSDQASGPAAEPRFVGSGWSAVVVATLPKGGSLKGMISKLPKVSGAWGTGRLLAGTVFSALVTDDGRVVVGAVPPAALYAALAAR